MSEEKDKKLSWKEKKEEKKKKKLIEDIKKKNESIKKQEEEIKKMALELKGGKLVKKAEGKEAAPQQAPQPVQQPTPAPAPVVEPIPVQPIPVQPNPQTPQQPMENPFDAAQTQMRQQIAQPLPEQGPLPPQQMVQEPAVPEMNAEEGMQDIPINFVLTHGITFQFVTKLGNLKDVLTYIAECINNNEVVELGRRLINPSQIVFYEY